MYKGGHTLEGEGTVCKKGGAHVGRGRRCLPTWPQEWEETDSLALPIQVCHPQPPEPSFHAGAPVTPQSPAAPRTIQVQLATPRFLASDTGEGSNSMWT